MIYLACATSLTLGSSCSHPARPTGSRRSSCTVRLQLSAVRDQPKTAVTGSFETTSSRMPAPASEAMTAETPPPTGRHSRRHTRSTLQAGCRGPRDSAAPIA